MAHLKATDQNTQPGGIATGHPGAAAPVNTDFLTGGGEMGERIRAFDWSSTPLGPIADWPQSMRSSASLCVKSSFPIIIHWGFPLTVLYNDAFLPFAGDKHPDLLGRPLFESWPELQPTLGPMLESVLITGKAALSDDLLLVYNRRGYLEETYYTLSFNPIVLESGKVGGSFSLIDYTTDRVIGERRLRTLRDLAARNGDTKQVEESYRIAAEVLAANPHDIPFALLYLLEANRKQARLVAAAGLEEGTPASPAIVDLAAGEPSHSGWPLAEVAASGRASRVDALEAKFGHLPGGAWPASPRTALVLPVILPGHDQPSGLLVAAVNPRKALDDAYQTFFNSVATQVAASLVGVVAYERLVELDRAKTTFFSNVSHEFRTPLSLILGPLEDMLSRDPTAATIGSERRDLELMHRNGLRLLKLVNTLLDFSRIEAGRIQALYEPVDLPAYTMELASTFRSAMSRAGLSFVIDCPPIPGPVYVDRDMWEKIVLNLLSNAFKYTLDGEIVVTLCTAQNSVELTVSDNGVGIPEQEVPRLFERFHRVEGQRGRTTEGTGIGLALVQELVKLHGGTVRVRSVVGRGTTFTVTIPMGTAHLPSERIGGERTTAPTEVHPEAFVEEALRWLPGNGTSSEVAIEKELIGPHPAEAALERAYVLVADDNADMLEYVGRLLGSRYEVRAVADGQIALETARTRRPDLILTDVMMPRLDGFGLLRAVRADDGLRDVPVVLLSARAGEEAKVEGLEAGADDYLLKPFSARELIARVEANLKLARLRREHYESERRYREAQIELAHANRFATMGQLSASIAHEIRQPMSAAVTDAKTCLRWLRRDRPDLVEAQEAASRLVKDVTRASDIINRVSLLFKKDVAQHELIDVNDVALEMIALLRSEAARHAISIHSDLTNDLPRTRVDRVGLQQIFMNLMLNGIEAMTDVDGLRRLTITSQVEPTGQVLVSVADTGVGLEAEQVDQIFDAFFTSKSQGTGLGLTISRSIVESHGGRLWAVPSSGPGATFQFTLPSEIAAREVA